MCLVALHMAPIWAETAEEHENVDNHIQNFHLERYIVGNHILWHRSRITVKLNYWPYIQRYTSLSENFE